MDRLTLAFAGVAALLVVTPGVDFATVLRSALRGRRQGLATCAGVLCGFVFHSALALAGVSAVLASSHTLFVALKLAGGAYLTWLGLRTLVSLALQVRRGRSGAGGVGPAPAATAAVAARPDLAAAFRDGLLGNALNPKAPVIWLSLLPQFIPSGVPVAPRVLLLSGILLALGALWYPLVVLAVSALRRLLTRTRARHTLEALTGTSLTALGIRTLLLDPSTR